MATLRFDPDPRAVINPWEADAPLEGCPRTVVSCFAHNLMEYAVERYGGEKIYEIEFANRTLPLYRIPGTALGLTMTFQGAPNAVSQYESLFALGVERILVFGTCGVLRGDIADCAIILPDSAVRDEGTSFHYAPPSDEIEANVQTLSLLRDFFREKGLSTTVGKVWTTDAFFRETQTCMAERQAQGCVAVEMECAALAALARFRAKRVAHFLYAADNLDAELWDARSLANHADLDAKRRLMDLAVELGARWEAQS